MNAVPHTHEVVIGESLEKTYISYGDTRVWLKGENPSERKIRKGVEKAIRQHDIGSQEAAKVEDARSRVREQFNDQLLKFQGRHYREPLEDLDEWPSVRMPEWEEEYEPEDPPRISPMVGKIMEFQIKNPIIAHSGDTVRLQFDDTIPAHFGLMSAEFQKSMDDVNDMLTKKEATE